MLNIWGSFPLSLYILISFYLIQTFPIYKIIMVLYMYYELICVLSGLPWWLNDKESACQCRRHGFNPWTAKILWRREWQHTLAFLPGKSHGQRRLVGYSTWDHKKVRHDSATKWHWSSYQHLLLTIYHIYFQILTTK